MFRHVLHDRRWNRGMLICKLVVGLAYWCGVLVSLTVCPRNSDNCVCLQYGVWYPKQVSHLACPVLWRKWRCLPSWELPKPTCRWGWVGLANKCWKRPVALHGVEVSGWETVKWTSGFDGNGKSRQCVGRLWYLWVHADIFHKWLMSPPHPKYSNAGEFFRHQSAQNL